MAPRIDSISSSASAYDVGTDSTTSPEATGQAPQAPSQDSDEETKAAASGLPRGPVGDSVAESAMKAQLRFQGGSQQTAAPAPVTGGAASASAAKAQQHEQWLGELARDPGEAHLAWKKLTTADRSEVLKKMEARYGKDFAEKFKEEVKKGKPQVETATYGSTPSSKFPMTTTEQLKARGYRKAGEEVTGTGAWDVEVWVHPSGKTARRVIERSSPGATQPGKQPAGATGPADAPSAGQKVDDPPPDEEDKQERAVVLLGQSQQALQEARNLLSRNPIPWDQVNATLMQSWYAQTELDSLMGDPSSDNPDPHPPDMSKVYPTFNQERETEAREYRKLYEETERNDPAAAAAKQQLDPSSGE